MEYRNLSKEEIKLLEKQNCRADNWQNIQVVKDFSPEKIYNSIFEQLIFIGNNVTIINSKLKNYKIGNNTLIENVACLSVEGQTTFGNGTSISVLNEGGGRELMIYDKLSSQIAYMIVTCRHDNDLIFKLNSMIKIYSESKKSEFGIIEDGASIKNCGFIKNVYIGESAVIEGAAKLYEGTILSSKFDPVYIGSNVIANHFIIQSGSSISDGAIIEKSFIGQSVKIGKQFSMENCAFFCNSEGLHGEAVSVFAGPYTVTHHKSTLLIALMCSFYNAGSGTNQSNHMYKLGPLHQGILERGAKTGSFSYMLWPSRVGAFSVVIGKHYTNFDASEFPFSYINEDDGKTMITPAMNIFTVGTKRDIDKWPARDRRKDPVKYDILNFQLFTPYIISKVLIGIQTLSNLLEQAKKEQELVNYKGITIKRLLIKTCIKYYEMIVKIFIGEELIKRLSSFSDIKSALNYNQDLFSEKWIDVAGLFITNKDYERIQYAIKSGEINNLDKLLEEFRHISKNYDEACWSYCAKLIEGKHSIKIEAVSHEHIARIINEWKENKIRLNNMILKDAEKEFDQNSRIGFGLDYEKEKQDKDFENVRGKFEENKFVSDLKKDSEQVEKVANEILAKFN